MSIFDGDFAGSLDFSDDRVVHENITDEINVIEEGQWEEVRRAVDHDELSLKDAERRLYRLHAKTQRLGSTALRAS